MAWGLAFGKRARGGRCDLTGAFALDWFITLFKTRASPPTSSLTTSPFVTITRVSLGAACPLRAFPLRPIYTRAGGGGGGLVAPKPRWSVGLEVSNPFPQHTRNIFLSDQLLSFPFCFSAHTTTRLHGNMVCVWGVKSIFRWSPSVPRPMILRAGSTRR